MVIEDFANYKLPSLFIGLGSCDWKCCKDANIPISTCQNSELAKLKDINVTYQDIYETYITNPITKAVVIGGLEPFTQFVEVVSLIDYFRIENNCKDTFVIYTGYKPNEIKDKVRILAQFPNIIIKYGRFEPNHKPHYDPVLGVNLVSDNQYGEIIS